MKNVLRISASIFLFKLFGLVIGSDTRGASYGQKWEGDSKNLFYLVSNLKKGFLFPSISTWQANKKEKKGHVNLRRSSKRLGSQNTFWNYIRTAKVHHFSLQSWKTVASIFFNYVNVNVKYIWAKLHFLFIFKFFEYLKRNRTNWTLAPKRKSFTSTL